MKRKPIVSALLLALFGAASVANSAHAASYEVHVLPLSDVSQRHFGTSIDNTGLSLVTARDLFNQPIDLSLLNIDDAPLTDPDAAAAGNFNDFDYTLVIDQLLQARASLGTIQPDARFQKLASDIGYKTDGTDVTYVNGFDSEMDGTDGFTFSSNVRLTDSALGTHVIGNMAGPFSRVDYVNENDEAQFFVVNEFLNRAFVQVGDRVTPLAPGNIDGGGFSEAYQINANLQVAGVSSVASAESLQEALALCLDDEQRGDVPVEVCEYVRFNQADTRSTFIAGLIYDNLDYETKATLWQLDAEGNIVSTQLFDNLYEPDEFSDSNHSRGLDVNNAGVMVGFSSVLVIEDRPPGPVAAIFENGVTTRLSDDDEFLPSFATNINDNNYIVGYVGQFINGAPRNKLFTFDRNTNEMNVVQGFFVGSATVPRALNNNNIVVGDAESEASISSAQRPRVGFIYDIESDTFTDLNTLLPCDSPYKIVSAVDINDNNEIIADAFTTVPRKNARGVVITDESGEALTLDTVVSVKLSPTGNTPSDCAEDDRVSRERQGASFSFWLLASLGTIVFFRFRR
ncbi:DUF3466 family protein [Agaribacter marinus]|uniref:DUF3466 family protein n=1 Tax=Agaribacter marinus TaxID=1431249 RepID=A0AA37SVB6_9ALTE|nr:DUF3466 family protein [Agaribacter marinus]GLR70123.1 hypothetical protein GCM10007852_10310 [Agaribacter marinus]